MTNFSQPTKNELNKALSEWMTSEFKLTHALTLTYPLPKKGCYRLDKIHSGEIKNVIFCREEKRPLLSWSSATLNRLQKDLYSLHLRVDRELFGARFNKKPLNSRTRFFAFPSGFSDGNMPHVHMAWSVPEKMVEIFDKLFQNNSRETFWQSLVSAGTHRLDRIYDQIGWIEYCQVQSTPSTFIISDSLISQKDS